MINSNITVKEYKEFSAKPNVLNLSIHSRLLADIESISSHAGVQQHYIKTSMSEYCGSGEIEWVKNYERNRKKGVSGLLLEGGSKSDIRCQSIAGALLRNYIDARIIPLNVLLDSAKDGYIPSPTVLIIPNLYSSLAKGLPAWRVQSIYDILLQRAVLNKSTVVFVENRAEMKNVFGESLDNLLDSYIQVKNI